MDTTSQSKNILRTYLRRLTNLSGNNRSLFLLKLYADQLIDLHEFNQLNGFRSFDIINSLIGGKDFRLCPVLDSRMEDSNDTSAKLKKLQRTDRFLFEERGSNDLHVGWPFLRGKFSDGTPVRCPLLFFPVTLVQENNSWYLHLRQQAGITLNKSFLLAYSFYNKVKLDEELLETIFEEFNADSTVFRTELYQLLKDKIEINFNADNFRDELVSFKPFKKSEFESQHKNGEIKLYPEAVLGIFPQAGSQLVPDYLHLIENDSYQDLEQFFLDKVDQPEQETPISSDIKEEKIYTPFTLDAYQEEAIKTVKRGNSIVVQGPPGTGKSQLICNLMADAIASGKRALLVCQKRAALDVVYNRLKSKELGDFVGLVHDFRNERKNIFARIARQIESIEDYQSNNRSIDVIQTERRFLQVCRMIDQITEELEQFKKALFDDKESGLSIKELYLTSDLNGPTINVRQEYRDLSFSVLPEYLRKLKTYNGYAKTFEVDDYLWRDRKSFANYTLSDLKQIEKAVLDVNPYQRQLNDRIQALIPVKLNIEECEALYARESEILAMIALLKNDIVYRYFDAMAEETEDETSLLWFTNVERMVLNCFEIEGVEATLPPDQLVPFMEALKQRTDAKGNFIKRIKWELTSKNKVWLKRVLVANNLSYSNEGLAVLEQRLDNRLNVEHHFTSIRQKSWILDLPDDYDLSKLKTWFTRQKLAIRAKVVLASLREVKKFVNIKKYDRSEFIDLFKSLLQILEEVPARKESWLNYLSVSQVRKLIYDETIDTEMVRVLKKDFDSLCDFDRLKDSMVEYEKSILNRLHESIGSWDYEKQEALLQNSLRLCWIEHIEAKFPYLRAVSSMKMEEQQKELLSLVEEKQKLSHDILLLRARERVYENIEYNRLNNRVTYRDLYHQVTKKKKVWPLRKVLSDYPNEVFRVMPCWMASPESVSAIFPMAEVFDLIIFDEASQCFAERGVPAMYRGKQIVIAGDDKQLKPNELYQVRWDEESEHPDLEVDSLLDMAKRYLPTAHLQGHYRSQSLELIDFSNKHFYEGRLRLLPDRHVLNEQQPGIEYHNVGGVWENNTNRLEAETVVKRVVELIRQNPKKEIGIVTFNAPQQVLIMDLFEEACAKEGLSVPASLFIKNIENVQGDEKDIIIFSVGYAKDKNNKLKMQFGSLSLSGGENRLNVAVTRAREKIILICSIAPEELKTEDLKNEGPRLLRKYLEFARDVHEQQFQPHIEEVVKKPSSWFLNAQLKQWGENKFNNLQFETGTLPLADLHFKKEGQHLGIVVTDDTRYFSSVSVKDSFAYVPSLFAQKNWEYHMVFSRNLWQDRERVEDGLLKFIGTRVQHVLN
ncbi:AAA domain-containing protein [Chryseosolibacter indicus]|uniref:DUF4011 domain-containing protein n=1 Tax=Chryseosolibacter indicus TaxID=2782351 RepID=A0ABS5VWW4_9BACT|nr:AAA domain-containing protein [Chryseosolibacter indicus]MBT1705913.1 DUF4011 domain-containing protein [Chryseosolibacter indicus]